MADSYFKRRLAEAMKNLEYRQGRNEALREIYGGFKVTFSGTVAVEQPIIEWCWR